MPTRTPLCFELVNGVQILCTPSSDASLQQTVKCCGKASGHRETGSRAVLLFPFERYVEVSINGQTRDDVTEPLILQNFKDVQPNDKKN